MAVFSRIGIVTISCLAFYTFNVFADDATGTIDIDNKHKQESITQSNTPDFDFSKKQWAWEGELSGDVLPKDLTQDEFVALLKQRFYGSFIFYRRLDVIGQSKTFLKYKEFTEPNINLIRKVIFNLGK